MFCLFFYILLLDVRNPMNFYFHMCLCYWCEEYIIITYSWISSLFFHLNLSRCILLSFTHICCEMVSNKISCLISFGKFISLLQSMLFISDDPPCASHLSCTPHAFYNSYFNSRQFILIVLIYYYRNNTQK
jgi:hypothetical protein